MKVENELNHPLPEESAAPRPLTLAENVILTLKLLAGLGVLGGAIWAINLWKFAE
jgi:hypothetical protein